MGLETTDLGAHLPYVAHDPAMDIALLCWGTCPGPGSPGVRSDNAWVGLSYTTLNTYYTRIEFLSTKVVRYHSCPGTVSWLLINLVTFFSEVQLYVQTFARYCGCHMNKTHILQVWFLIGKLGSRTALERAEPDCRGMALSSEPGLASAGLLSGHYSCYSPVLGGQGL